jgi:subtilisin family serine protease
LITKFKESAFFFLLLFGLSHVMQAQQKFWVFFDERETNAAPAISGETIENRRMLQLQEIQASDFPLKKSYIDSLQALDIEIHRQSRWLNAVSAELTPEQKRKLSKISFVKGLHEIIVGSCLEARAHTNNNADLRVDYALKQMGVEGFLFNNLDGTGVNIGVIDVGFYGLEKDPALAHAVESQRIKAVHDYINPAKVNHFDEKETESDFHGTEVLKAIGGKIESEDILLGISNKASFYLARTDSGKREFRGEEDNWVAAIEWLDSLGVRLVNTSLGYGSGFTDPDESYLPENMDGKTSVISKAATLAVKEKGMILVVSAGNEGENPAWQVVSTPGDAHEPITVGASDEHGLKMGYSSIGPDFLPYVKPDVSCYALYGTSFAAPLMTGFIGALLQLKPDLKSEDIKEVLFKSGDMYPFPNNYVGYGFPNALKSLSILLGQEIIKPSEKVKVKDFYELKDIKGAQVLVFHKTSPTLVNEQFRKEIKKKAFKIERPEGITHTTLVLADRNIEIEWEE